MLLKMISRAAVGGSLTLIRIPLDAALRLAPDGSGWSLTLVLDRVDATVRDAAGLLLADEALRDDARRRAEATDERARAMRLRDQAEEVSERADEWVAKRQSEAERRRRGASESADRRREQARERRDSKKEGAAQRTRSRKTAARRSAERSGQQIDEEAKRDRLGALDTKSGALEQREKAQVAAEEARRLRAAASATKAERKAGD